MKKLIKEIAEKLVKTEPKKKEVTFGDAMVLKSMGFGAVCEDGQVVRFERED